MVSTLNEIKLKLKTKTKENSTNKNDVIQSSSTFLHT